MTASFDTPAVQALAALAQWVTWRRVWRGDEPTKPPFTAEGLNASATNPSTWTSFEAALRAVPTPGHDRGIGYVFTADDPFVGIDIDGCRNPQTGHIATWARPIIRSLHSYTEISPSGTGVKIAVQGSLPQPGRKTELPNVERVSFKAPAIEMYASARYFTITGEHVAGTPQTIEPAQAALDELFARFFPDVRQDGSVSRSTSDTQGHGSPGLTDEQVLELAFGARNGQRVRALYEAGDISAYAEDDSRADQALCSYLAFYAGDDEDQLFRLIQASALYRPKWDRADYAQRTMRRAIDNLTGVYQRPGERTNGAVVRDGAPEHGLQASAEPERVLARPPAFPVHVLPAAAQRLVNESSLPSGLLAGSVLAALLAACGDNVEVEYSPTQIERPIGFIVNMAPKSAGKTPAQRIGLQPLVALNRDLRAKHQEEKQRWQDKPRSGRGEYPASRAFIRKRITPEALLRDLARQPALLACPDELEATLRDLAGYRAEQSHTSGLAILLELWTGEPQDYTRVGRSDGEHNQIDLYIDRPTLVLVGGLQTVRHSLLGPVDDGIRPRWLLHLAERPEAGTRRDPTDAALAEYATLIETIFERRGVRRRWVLDAQTRALFDAQALAWKQQAAGGDVNDSVSAALDKADAQVLKIVGALAEAMLPALPTHPMPDGQPQLLDLPIQAMRDAIVWMTFILDCWACLEGGTPLARSQRERAVIEAANRVMDYVDARGAAVRANKLRENGVGGIQTSDQLHEVLDMIDAMYPGTVERIEAGPKGGRPGRVVYPRPRRGPPSGAPENPDPTRADSASTHENLPIQSTKTPWPTPDNCPSTVSAHENSAPNRVSETVSNLKTSSTVPEMEGNEVFSSCARARDKENSSPDAIGPADVACRACGEPLRQVHETHLALHDDCTLPFSQPRERSSAS
ncbi:MAG: DUF3987 domain-containing protein [Chloroflexi bacterium]|nr:DUF3987 domain-containing protein [Chloroflexota bacterium]